MANRSAPDPGEDHLESPRRAREDAEETVSLLRATLDATADGILVVNRSGRIVTFNRKFVQMWRIPDALVAARDSSQTLAFVLDQLKDPAAFVKRTMELYAHPEAEGLDMVEFRDGRIFERFSCPQRIGGEIVGRVSSFRDATERRLADEEIERTLSILQATLDATADGLLVVGASGRIVIYNQRFADMWRIPHEIVASRNDDHLLAFVLDQLKSPDRFLKKVKEIYGEPESQSYDWLDFKDGRVFERYSCPQRIGERVVGRVWSFRDVTDRRRAEEVVQRQARAFEHITDGVVLIDLEGRVLDWNSGAEKMFGYSKAQVLGKALPVLGGPGDPGARLPAMIDAVRQGARWSEEIAFRSGGGVERVCRLAAVRLWDRYGRTVSVLLIAYDLTELRRLEERLRRLEGPAGERRAPIDGDTGGG